MLKSYPEIMRDDPDDQVPPDVRRYWKRRAVAAGLPLDEYLLRKMQRDAQRPANAEIFADIDRDSTADITVEEIVETIRELRESR